jgi:cellulose synthase/poly-beta-1,6-N-acetylglucosamine synthase-like glycosyltransferase
VPDILFVPVLIGYLAVLSLLFVFGVNFVYLTVLALRSTKREPAAVIPDVWPVVTVQLPIYNELYVAGRLIDAVAAFDYPKGRLEIQVLDDSTDETSLIAAEHIERWRARGVDIHHVRRAGRDGFKAGALGHGLAAARGELIAIFDADFVPQPSFLRETVPVMVADAGLAFVQARWTHTNRDYSLLTKLQALSIDGHFAVEQAGRWAGGYWFNFNGTAGVWRRSAIDDAGGWTQDTLTEDLDISYRAALRGWRAAYVKQVAVPAELPVSFNAYRRQQGRWSRGSFECAFKHMPAIWHARVPLRRRIEATLHLTGYSIHLLLLSMSLLYPLILTVAGHYPVVLSLFGVMAIFNLTTLAPTLLFTMAQRQLHRNWLAQIPTILLLSGLGAGMMVQTARAAWQALGGHPAAFERTPKFGVRRRQDEWLRLRYQLGIDRIVIVEAALAVLNLFTCLTAIRLGSWAIALYTLIFCLGLTSAVLLTVGQTVRTMLAARERQPVEAEASGS